MDTARPQPLIQRNTYSKQTGDCYCFSVPPQVAVAQEQPHPSLLACPNFEFALASNTSLLNTRTPVRLYAILYGHLVRFECARSLPASSLSNAFPLGTRIVSELWPSAREPIPRPPDTTCRHMARTSHVLHKSCHRDNKSPTSKQFKQAQHIKPTAGTVALLHGTGDEHSRNACFLHSVPRVRRTILDR